MEDTILMGKKLKNHPENTKERKHEIILHFRVFSFLSFRDLIPSFYKHNHSMA